MKQLFFVHLSAATLFSCEQYCDCVKTVDPCDSINNTFPGFWKATSSTICRNVANSYYTVTFNESEDCQTAILYNFLGDGEKVMVEFRTTSIVIPNQALDKDDDIFGIGFFKNDTLKITFTTKDRDFGWEDLCKFVAVKK